MMTALSLASVIPNHLFGGNLRKHFFDLSIFTVFFNHNFIIGIDFTRIGASNTATDNVTN